MACREKQQSGKMGGGGGGGGGGGAPSCLCFSPSFLVYSVCHEVSYFPFTNTTLFCMV